MDLNGSFPTHSAGQPNLALPPPEANKAKSEIQTKIKKILEHSQASSKRVSAAAAPSDLWLLARVEALYDTVHNSGNLTEEQEAQLSLLSTELEAEEAKVNQESSFVTKQEIKRQNKCLNIAKEALLELRKFEKASVNDSEENSLPQLITLVGRLQKELIDTSNKMAPAELSIMEKAHALQEIKDRQAELQQIEKKIALLTVKSNLILSEEDRELEKFGKKHGNLVRLARLSEGLELEGVSVPLPHGIQSDKVELFLRNKAPALFEYWEKLGQLYADYRGATPFLEQKEAKELLEQISTGIKQAFSLAGSDPSRFQELGGEELSSWLREVQQNGDYLMVRSTGAEDSRKSANAGGNLSVPYVRPTEQAFCDAAGEVIASYFSFNSLQNRINADENPFAEPLKLSVTSQQLIGETVDDPHGASKDIPISCVLFTSEPLYVGEEKFRTMRISATYGHGEGVVGAQGIASDTVLLLVSETHPERLYVMYDNQSKPVRLAPVKEGDSIELKPVHNPKELRKKPVLDDALLARLYTLGVVTEMFFGDKATDMEIVIKKDTIYPVQARPVNRLPLLPTYVDRKKIAAQKESPVIDSLDGESLVAGRGNVIQVTHPSEVCFANSLEEAERIYNKEKHKVVIVTQPEPSNSHPVVNFSGLGVTCLQVADGKKMADLLAETNPNTCLVIDSQTGEVFRWQGDPASCVSEGFAVHPAKLALSITRANVKLTRRGAQIPQDVKELLAQIRAAETHEQAIGLLMKLQGHEALGKLSRRKEALLKEIENSRFIPKRVQKALKALEDIELAIKSLFEETLWAYRNATPEERLNPLIRVKALDTVLSGRKVAAGNGIGQYTLTDTKAIKKEAMVLVNYQKKFDHPVHFSKIYLASEVAKIPAVTQAWQQFLEDLETKVAAGSVSTEQVTKLHHLIKVLQQTGMLSYWFTFFFPSDPNKIATLEEILETLPDQDEALIQTCSELAEQIQNMKGGISAFKDPKTFRKALENMTELLNKLKSEPLLLEGNNASPVVQIMLRQTMLQGVDLFDSAIKEMKSSTAFSQIEKVPLFKEMLGHYLDLFVQWIKLSNIEDKISLHLDWPIDRYIETLLSAYYYEFKTTETSQLAPSRDFSVAAAVLGAATAFGRHRPKTLEDLFTLIHQNLLVLLSTQNAQVLNNQRVNDSRLSTSLKEFMSEVTRGMAEITRGLSLDCKQTNISLTETGPIIHYNIPLRDHSATLTLRQDLESGEIFLTGHLFGQARLRWGLMSLGVHMMENQGLFRLGSPPKASELELEIEWKLNSIEELRNVVKEFKKMCDLSLNLRLGEYADYCVVNFDLIQIEKTAVDGAFDPNPIIRRASLEMLNKVLNKTIATEALIRAVIENSRDLDDSVRKQALLLLKALLKKNVHSEIIWKIIAQELSNSNERIRSDFNQLLIDLADQSNASYYIKKISLELVSSEERALRQIGMNLFICLTTNNQINLDEVKPIAIQGLKDSDKEIRNKALELARLFVVRNELIAETCEVVREIPNDPIINKKIVIDLIPLLIDNGLESNIAFEVADLTLHEPDTHEAGYSLEVFRKLISSGKHVGQCLDSLAKVMQETELDAGRNERYRNIINFLQRQLQKSNDNAIVNLAIAMASASLSHHQFDVRENAKTLFIELFNKKKGFKEAQEAASLAIMSEDERVRNDALKIFKLLFSYNWGFVQASSLIQKGEADPEILAKLQEALPDRHKYYKFLDSQYWTQWWRPQ